MEIEVWRTPPGSIHVAPGFAAIVPSDQLEARLRGVLRLGGWAIAALDHGALVGYASIVPPSPIVWPAGSPDGGELVARRWDALPGVLELGALEVARPFRASGLGTLIASTVANDERLDRVVLFGIGVTHHWDLGWSALPPYVHRLALEATLRHAGMAVRRSTDPEVLLHPANALFARFGAHVAPEVRGAFEAAS